jgi:hypothetical protein
VSTTGTTPGTDEVKQLCRRARAAGAPRGAARSRLVNDYRRLAAGLSVEAVEVATGADLVRATAALLHVAARRPALGTRPGPRR